MIEPLVPISGADVLEMGTINKVKERIYLTPEVIEYRIDSMMKSLFSEQRRLLSYFD